MMVNWLMTRNKKIDKNLDELHALPYDKRKRDPRLEQYTKDMYNEWSSSEKKYEKYATLGWKEYESMMTLCDLIENLPQLRKDYLEQVMLYGLPEFDDDQFDKYEKELQKQRKEAEKKSEQ